jgi:hypothetical protein
MVNLVLEVFHFTFIRRFIMIRLPNFSEKVGTPSLELFVTELPEPRFLICFGILYAKGIRLDFSETVEIELANK